MGVSQPRNLGPGVRRDTPGLVLTADWGAFRGNLYERQVAHRKILLEKVGSVREAFALRQGLLAWISSHRGWGGLLLGICRSHHAHSLCGCPKQRRNFTEL